MINLSRFDLLRIQEVRQAPQSLSFLKVLFNKLSTSSFYSIRFTKSLFDSLIYTAKQRVYAQTL